MSTDHTSLKSISARANTFSSLAVIVSIVGAILFLLLFQQHANQETKRELNSRANLLAYIVEEQVEFYRRIFKRLSKRPELLEILALEDKDLATTWSRVRNRLIPDGVGIGVFTGDGRLLGKPRDHYIGKSCLKEMKMHSRGINFPKPPIHSGPERLTHFDIISDIKRLDGSRAGLLFSSISTGVLKATLDQIVRVGESIELYDGKNKIIVKTHSGRLSDNTVMVTRSIANTDWTFKAKLIKPTPSSFYYWGIAGVILAVIMLAISVTYLIRISLTGLVGEMESIRSGLEKIFSGNFDGSMPKPHFRETADVNAAIERISNLIYKQNQNLTAMSETDELTGLFNRRRILHELKRLLARVSRGAQAVVVLMDLDNFKVINDKHGHAVGDQVLKAIADALLETRRGSDLVARIGGDEFIAILIDSSSDSGAWYERLSESFKVNMREAMLLENEYCTISAGALVLDGSTVETPESVLLRVDSALYKAKESGRSRMVVAGN